MKIDLISWSSVKLNNQAKRKVAPKLDNIDYKDIHILRKFTSDVGRILPAKYNGISAKNQRCVNIAIKRARFMALMPYLKVGDVSWK